MLCNAAMCRSNIIPRIWPHGALLSPRSLSVGLLRPGLTLNTMRLDVNRDFPELDGAGKVGRHPEGNLQFQFSLKMFSP